MKQYIFEYYFINIGFSLCFILSFLITDLRNSFLYTLCAPPSMFPLVFTTIYEVFSLTVLLGKVVSQVLINEAKRRSLKLQKRDVYWKFGRITERQHNTQQDQNTSQSSSSANAAQNSLHNPNKEMKRKKSPEEKKLRKVAKVVHWIISFLFLIAYILCTVADPHAVALHYPEEDVGFANAITWTVLMLVVAGICFLSTIIDMVADWWIQIKSNKEFV